MEIAEREKKSHKFNERVAIWNVTIGYWIPWRNMLQILNKTIIIVLFPVKRSVGYMS